MCGMCCLRQMFCCLVCTCGGVGKRNCCAVPYACVIERCSFLPRAAQDDADHQRELYASIANQLVMNYLMSPAGT